jgi:hypothetical protein
MTTLIIEYKHGRRVAQCDARCYNASGKVCTCCCQGVNHGVGLHQALENTRKLTEKYADEDRFSRDWDKGVCITRIPLIETELVATVGL